jgi:hypothetical protein
VAVGLPISIILLVHPDIDEEALAADLHRGRLLNGDRPLPLVVVAAVRALSWEVEASVLGKIKKKGMGS